MNLRYSVTILCLMIGVGLSAQSLEDDISILYMKANVLYDSGRYDESVRMYNRLLGDDDSFAKAYLMRAKAKYELSAYKGTKKDVLEFIAIQGVTKEVIKLMSKTEYQLENFEAAHNYVKTALELDPYDAEQYRVAGDIEIELGHKNEACEMWYSASELGDSKSKRHLEEKCGIYMKMKEEHIHKKDKQQDEDMSSDQEKVDEDDDDDEVVMEEQEDGKQKIEAPDMDAMQEIEVDDELSIVVGNGLGKRKIENEPSIFMLADKSGRVVIDACVDKRGNVKSAELNKDQTNLFKAGIISLALRKTKEFSFFPSFRDEQCGQFIYIITTGDK